jgi:radical SAM protein with 4Fe4S-binding SPASM domain
LGAAFRAAVPRAIRRWLANLTQIGLLARRRDWQAAIRAQQFALKLDPDGADRWVQLGTAFKEHGDLDQADAAYRRAIEIDPSHLDAWLMWAVSMPLSEAAKFDRAAKVMQHFSSAEFNEQQRRRFVEFMRWKAERHAARAWSAMYHAGSPEDVRETADQDLAAAAACCRQGLAHSADDEALRTQAHRVRRMQDTRSRRIPEARRVMDSLRYLAFGTTGICNASCIHCPTGKEETAHVPRMDMPLPLFRKVVEGVHALGLAITEQVSFGLFGDGLVDRLVVERARILREYYPATPLFVNTNGAAFNPTIHRALLDLNAFIGLHVESLVPDTYATLMAPLRLKVVEQKIEQLVSCFGHRVHVSVPVSRRNSEELPSIRDHFLARGVGTVAFDPLASRCRDDDRLFRSLAFAPQRVACAPEVLDDLIVDCDGKVLMCCQDFQRREIIGDLGAQSVAEVLGSAERHAARVRFVRMEHDKYATCSRCFADGACPTVGRVAYRG